VGILRQVILSPLSLPLDYGGQWECAVYLGFFRLGASRLSLLEPEWLSAARNLRNGA